VRNGVGDFLHFFRVERRLAPLTCSAYESDMRTCIRFLSEHGIGDLSLVRAADLRRFLAAEAERRPALGSQARTVAAVDLLLRAGEKPRVAASVEVAGEVAEAVLELDVPAVRALVVDDEHVEVLERPLEHASTSLPCRASGRELVERVGAVRGANAIYATQHVVKRARWRRGRSGSLPYRYGHRFEFTSDEPPGLAPAALAQRPGRATYYSPKERFTDSFR